MAWRSCEEKILKLNIGDNSLAQDINKQGHLLFEREAGVITPLKSRWRNVVNKAIYFKSHISKVISNKRCMIIQVFETLIFFTQQLVLSLECVNLRVEPQGNIFRLPAPLKELILSRNNAHTCTTNPKKKLNISLRFFLIVCKKTISKM